MLIHTGRQSSPTNASLTPPVVNLVSSPDDKMFARERIVLVHKVLARRRHRQLRRLGVVVGRRLP